MKIKDILHSTNSRTALIKKNIVGSFVIKGISVLVSLVLVPLTIDYVNAERYGIWLTIASVVGWIGFFDVGFGNGLRNKLAESKAKGNYESCRAYISTTYFFTGGIFLFLLVIFNFLASCFNWAAFLNVSAELNQEILLIVRIVFSLFCVQFILKTISTIIIANQEPAKSSFIDMIAQLVSLIVIFFLTKFASSSLIYLAFCFAGIPVVILLVASVFFFRGEYKLLLPSVRYVKLGIAKEILSLGLKFFVIQIAVLIIYQTTNIIISNVSGPEAVTEYNVAYKYLSVSFMVYSIILTPFWSAFTDAYTQRDFAWMNQIYNKLLKLTFCILVGIIVMQFVSPLVYKIWVGDKVSVSNVLSLWIAVYMGFNIWNSLHAFIINGIGKIKLQLYISLTGMVGNVPLALYLGKIYGVNGVVISSILFCILPAFLLKIQVDKILKDKVKGIWNK